MHISGERRLPFGRDLVWATLNDPVALKACVPGCDRFVAVGDNRYDAAFKAKVGPLRATIRGWVSVEDIVAPERYRLVAEGQGGV
ncbi:MAG: SRPBCC domain-containing protein, partial [Pseudomonadota bacterium]